MPRLYDMREPYRDQDPHRQEKKFKDQQHKEHLTFRSFCTGQGRDVGATAFLAPPPRRPGLVVGTGAVQEPGGMGAIGAHLGEQVLLQNMKRRQDLNGLTGTVVSDKTDQFGRVYVNISQKDAEPRVIKVLPERLYRQGDERDGIPSWMPKGREPTDPLGASFWSSSGIRTGFPGFGIMQESATRRAWLWVLAQGFSTLVQFRELSSLRKADIMTCCHPRGVFQAIAQNFVELRSPVLAVWCAAMFDRFAMVKPVEKQRETTAL